VVVAVAAVMMVMVMTTAPTTMITSKCKVSRSNALVKNYQDDKFGTNNTKLEFLKKKV
jgi:hypothetical protein